MTKLNSALEPGASDLAARGAAAISGPQSAEHLARLSMPPASRSDVMAIDRPRQGAVRWRRGALPAVVAA